MLSFWIIYCVAAAFLFRILTLVLKFVYTPFFGIVCLLLCHVHSGAVSSCAATLRDGGEGPGHVQEQARHGVHAAGRRPSPLRLLLRDRERKGRKAIAASLAFPLPFGIVGLHRIFLGSSPYVPVAYIASLGGVFGVLPFIDFCVLLAAKETTPYTDNKKIFMWVE